MKKVLFLLVCISLIFAVSKSFAFKRYMGLGGDFGYNDLFGGDSPKADGWVMGNFKLRMSVSENNSVSLLLSGGYGVNYGEGSYVYRTNLIPIDLNVVYAFAAEDRTSLYLTLGAGVMRWDSNNRYTDVQLDKQWDPAFGAGIGMDIFLNCDAALDFNFKYRYILTDDRDMIGIGGTDNQHLYVGVGIMFYPGGGGDSDGDGVSDCLDRCPETRMGCDVDKYGCSQDSDGDGVCDGRDECPRTPEGCAIDEQGCPKDSDNDGVCDGKDRCPGTPKGCLVDERGCPKDPDGDGVCDGLDACPNTQAGVPVDERGCPVAMPDISEIEQIRFSFDKTIITPIPNPTLDYVYDIIKLYPEVRIVIHGHTDNVGSDEYNMQLGRRRAQAAKDYLVTKGSPPGRILIATHGEEEPIASNDTEEGRAQNRRVEFRVYERERE
jgi:OOP family OmpA-OmpF porin